MRRPFWGNFPFFRRRRLPASEPSDLSYDELLSIFGDEDPSTMTVDDAAWDVLMGVMGKWTDFLCHHACDPTTHPWLSRLRTLGQLLSLRTLAESGLVFSNEESETSVAFEQTAKVLNATAWATLEQLILIGMASHAQTHLLLPAGDDVSLQVTLHAEKVSQLSPISFSDDCRLLGDEENLRLLVPHLYTATWRVSHSDGRIADEAPHLGDLDLWLEPSSILAWDELIPTPANLCRCKENAPFGEESADGNYFADEWVFGLHKDWQGHWHIIGLALKGGEVIGVHSKAIEVPAGVGLQVLRKEASLTCQRGKALWMVRCSLSDHSSRTMHLFLEMPPSEPATSLPPLTECQWEDEIRWSCPATPYVAEALKVTGNWEASARLAWKFLPKGKVKKLIRQIWQGKGVSWREWVSAILHYLPGLKQVEPSALKGVAGAIKWFLNSLKLRRL